MISFLQTGKALYVLAAICLAGIFSRLIAGSSYKRLIKESTDTTSTKDKCLCGLKQNAEDTYRINQGVSNTRVYLEHQMYDLRMAGVSVGGLDNLSGQLTLLCFLAGGITTLLSHWYRSDSYYIVLYGTIGILAGILTMLVDCGVNLEAERRQLLTCMQDYMESVTWPRMNRGGGAKHVPVVTAEEERRDPALVRSITRDRRSNNNNRRGLDQTAVSKERQEDKSKDNWLQDLNPEQKRMLGELLEESISRNQVRGVRKKQ